MQVVVEHRQQVIGAAIRAPDDIGASLSELIAIKTVNQRLYAY